MNTFNEVKSSKTGNNVSCRFDSRERNKSGINYSAQRLGKPANIPSKKS